MCVCLSTYRYKAIGCCSGNSWCYHTKHAVPRAFGEWGGKEFFLYIYTHTDRNVHTKNHLYFAFPLTKIVATYFLHTESFPLWVNLEYVKLSKIFHSKENARLLLLWIWADFSAGFFLKGSMYRTTISTLAICSTCWNDFWMFFHSFSWIVFLSHFILLSPPIASLKNNSLFTSSPPPPSSLDLYNYP